MDRLTRRSFASIVTASALQTPSLVRSQAFERKAHIGFLVPSRAPTFAHLFQAFDRGLRAHGLLPGQNVLVDVRSSDGRDDAFPRLADDLVAAKPDLIVAVTVPAIRSAQASTSTIPIVMLLSSDPVQLGLVASLSRPGANTTGLASAIQDLVPKRLELLKEVVPGLSRASALWNPANPAMVAEWQLAKNAADAMNVSLQSVEIKRPDELESALATIEAARPQALMVVADPLTLQLGPRIVAFAAQNRLPAVYGIREMVVAGGLMSYGTNLVEQFFKVGGYVDRLLKGARPADLPVEQPAKLDVVVNLRSAREIGVTLPQSLLIRADETIN
jgi:putative ABC transport system substrate-binding protein